MFSEFAQRFNAAFGDYTPFEIFGVGLAISLAFFMVGTGIKVVDKLVDFIIRIIERRKKG